MLKVASHVDKCSTLSPNLDVFNSDNVHISFPAILDSGATSGFVPASWQEHMINVVNLKTPVKVKLGTSTSYARSKGLIPISKRPICKRSRQTRLSDMSYGVLLRR